MHEMGIAAFLILHNSFVNFVSQNLHMTIKYTCLNIYSLKTNNFRNNAQVSYFLLNIFISVLFS